MEIPPKFMNFRTVEAFSSEFTFFLCYPVQLVDDERSSDYKNVTISIKIRVVILFFYLRVDQRFWLKILNSVFK